MKIKSIKSILRKVHSDFVASIEDEEVRKLVDKNSIITGGAIASMLLKEPVNDYDYYFTNKETAVAVANYYVNKFKELNPKAEIKPRVVVDNDGRVRILVQSGGVISENDADKYQYFESAEPEEAGEYIEKLMDTEKIEEKETHPKYRPVFLSENAITLSNKIQLVIRFYGDAEEIHSNYDFVHAMSWWRSEDGFLETPVKTLQALLARELVYNGSKYPLASIIRTRKFINRGWQINAGQYLKMVMQLNELNLTDVNVLKEQLTGMDVAYFRQVIGQIERKMEEDSDFRLSSTYLIEVINRMF